jgi:prostaglandin-H2 D-isomerase / glutathione transferase
LQPANFYRLNSFEFVVKMAPHIKLIYVDAKALAEPIRFLFAYGNIKYDDFRMTHEDFKSDKSSKLFEATENLLILMYVLLACLGFPYNKIPNVEIDGKLVHQSMAIARYFAKQVGLAGTSLQEELLVDMAVDTLADYRHRKRWHKFWFFLSRVFFHFSLCQSL